MGKLLAVIRREYLERVRSRWFLIATTFGPVFFGLLMFLPALIASREKTSGDASKIIIIDGRLAYLGSANLTGAGIGAKNDHRRNFESGILTDDAGIVSGLMEELDTLWRGEHCLKCQRRDVCPDPIA